VPFEGHPLNRMATYHLVMVKWRLNFRPSRKNRLGPTQKNIHKRVTQAGTPEPGRGTGDELRNFIRRPTTRE